MKHYHKLFYILFFITAFNGACAQSGFVYKAVKKHPLQAKNQLRNTVLSQNPDIIDITSLLPKGYVTDGTVDYTRFIQTGINNYEKVLMPNFSILVNDGGLSIPSNRLIVFNTNSKLILKSSQLQSYQIIRIWEASNIKLYFPCIEGDRDRHTGTGGEWGMGLGISSSTNIEVYYPEVYNCWGDGLYLGVRGDSGTNNSILIYYGFFDNNRRNGISIISGTNIKIKNPIIANTNGTNPQCGIDIEPNTNKEVINNIRIENALTYNNYQKGILVSLVNHFGPEVKNVGIDIINHTDYSMRGGFSVVGADSRKFSTATKAMQGQIKIIGPKWYNGKGATYKKNDLDPLVKILP
ncbi:right-handed parallel beta-helix repeat-containing protein [Niabella hirudinis]|uniref:right-handed parallel beta-helix repeat-containing protein n=1 Tax=Niabella hirudinis TaxID=1285929 RepID=UPI003EBC26E4